MDEAFEAAAELADEVDDDMSEVIRWIGFAGMPASMNSGYFAIQRSSYSSVSIDGAAIGEKTMNASAEMESKMLSYLP